MFGHKPYVAQFEAERDASAYGHGATVTRYMRHFQDCLDNDLNPLRRRTLCESGLQD
jgi:hypothetical protein